ncbi:MAG: hypothetical protein QOH90_595 [Actinomycetota bacterium]|nr:hypothetical protein [Actinomycetota bacterium]
MRSLIWVEAKRAARSPLLWLGVALVTPFVWLNLNGYWPIVPRAVEHAYGGIAVLAGFATLTGAWVGLRDIRAGAESLIASTPAAQKATLVPARMLALALGAFVTGLAAFGAAIAVAKLRGALGSPSLDLILDASFFVAGAACAGFAIAYFTRSRAVCLLVGPLLAALDVIVVNRLASSYRSAMWLVPNPRTPQRFPTIGYLPDIFVRHTLYVLALTAILFGAVWLKDSIRTQAHRATAICVLLVTLGSGTALASGTWLAHQPVSYAVFGTRPDQWLPMDGRTSTYKKMGQFQRKFGVFADDGSASECASEGSFEVCVFPEFGERFARDMADVMTILEPFADFPDFPHKLRMVPEISFADCVGVGGLTSGDSEYLLSSQNVTDVREEWEFTPEGVFRCSLYGRRMLSTPAKDAVNAWYGSTFGAYPSMRGGYYTKNRLQRRTTNLMLALEPDEVITRLRPIWADLQKGNFYLPGLERVMSR